MQPHPQGPDTSWFCAVSLLAQGLQQRGIAIRALLELKEQLGDDHPRTRRLRRYAEFLRGS